MLDRIHEIDTGAIEELTRIKRDQEVLEDRLRLMQERREGVSEVVFERVRGDYRRRLDGLDEEARPLKERARREYAKLQALRAELTQARDEAQLEKEETEFRNGLGEFAAGEYEQRAADCAERVTARQGELAEVEALRERFLGSCRSPEELEGAEEAAGESTQEAVEAMSSAGTPPPADTPPPALEEPFAPPSLPEPDLDAAAAVAPLVADQDAAALTPPLPTPGDFAFDDGKTSRLPPEPARSDVDPTALEGPPGDEPDMSATGDHGADWHEAPTGTFAVPPLPPGTAPPEGPVSGADDDELSGATRILSRPRLVEMENGASGREHALALGRTSIGRASDNLVHLLDEAVSRHHAEVIPGPHGYLLRDLGSENGIFVNGERTPEHVLREGDVIQIGARTLVFHGA